MKPSTILAVPIKPVSALAQSLTCVLALTISQSALAHGDHKHGEAHEITDSDITVTTLAEGLVHPWGMAFLPNGDLLVTEREGGIQRLSKDGKLSGRLGNVPKVVAQNQGGMLGVAIDPTSPATTLSTSVTAKRVRLRASRAAVAVLQRLSLPTQALKMLTLSLVPTQSSITAFTLAVV